MRIIGTVSECSKRSAKSHGTPPFTERKIELRSASNFMARPSTSGTANPARMIVDLSSPKPFTRCSSPSARRPPSPGSTTCSARMPIRLC